MLKDSIKSKLSFCSATETTEGQEILAQNIGIVTVLLLSSKLDGLTVEDSNSRCSLSGRNSQNSRFEIFEIFPNFLKKL